MKVLISIDLGNDAMQTRHDVYDAIRLSMKKHTSLFAPLAAGDGGPVVDTNGNTVGRWAVSG